ncbi:MAG: hypothetical protein AAB842_02695 [Patescibacteria group bacterium]
MDNNTEEKPMTIRDFQEVIMPAMEEVFSTKKDLENIHIELRSFKQEVVENFASKVDITEFKRDFSDFKNESLNYFDKILKDLDILMTEKEVGYFQKKKERKLWAIMIDALQKHQILSNEQIQEIKALEIF